MKLKKLDVITIRTLNDAYEHIKNGEKGCHPGTGGRYTPSKTEDFRHKAMIPIYRLDEVCTDVIESGWKGATVMIGGDMVIFRFDPSIKSYTELTTFMSA